MFIIWRGNGPLILLLWLLVSIAVALLVGQETYARNPGYIGLAFLISAAGCFVLDRTLLPHVPERPMTDLTTGKVYHIEIKHTLFWMTAKTWGWIFLAAGIAGLVAEVLLKVSKQI